MGNTFRLGGSKDKLFEACSVIGLLFWRQIKDTTFVILRTPMLNFLRSILPWLSGGLGVLLIYASFSYEDEEGRIQNRLEEWWIRIDDLRRHAISSHIAFMKVLASVATAFLDRLFGVRVLSVQAVGVSMCYSILCVGIALLILSRLNPETKTSILDTAHPILFGGVYGTIPALLQATSQERLFGIKFIHYWFGWLWLSILIFFFNPFGSIILFALATPGLRKEGLGLLAVVIFVLSLVLLAMILFTLFIGIMRATLKVIVRSESPLKIVGLSLLNAAPILFFGGLIAVMGWWATYSSGLANLMLILLLVIAIFGILFNFAFFLSAVLFVFLATIMLLHRLFWPIIQRPLYRLQALGIAKRPLLFRLVGVALITAALGKHEWLQKILEKL